MTGDRFGDFIGDDAEVRLIVSDLAMLDPIVIDYNGKEGRNYCALCVSDGGRPTVTHVPECPWLRSVAHRNRFATSPGTTGRKP